MNIGLRVGRVRSRVVTHLILTSPALAAELESRVQDGALGGPSNESYAYILYQHLTATTQFRPRSLNELHYHQGLSARLRSLVREIRE